MEGKRVAITGATSGTGFVAACACVKKGAEIILLNRPSERAEEAERKIREEFPGAIVHSIPCDLSDFTSVRAVKHEFLKIFQSGYFGGVPQLDILCCNAGIMLHPDKATKDGFDVQMQTNHLSHFLLVKDFFPALEAAAAAKGEARIVNHTAFARHGSPLDEKYLRQNGGELGGDTLKACGERYHHTKLANIVFTYALDARLKARGSKVKAVCASPGFAATSLFSNVEAGGTDLGAMKCFLYTFGPLTMQSSADGTMPMLLCMAGDGIESGDLITPSESLWWRTPPEAWGLPSIFKRPLPYPEKSYVCEDEQAQSVLWKESQKAIGESFEI